MTTLAIRPNRTKTLAERFGDNLKTAREQSDLSQVALGRRAGISSSEVSRLEAGVREPRLTTILSLAQALDMEGTDLIRGLDRSLIAC